MIAVAPASDVVSRVEYRVGTHRRVPPRVTLARVQGLARDCGVTRLADITGLDRIGIPVFQAVRPLGRSVSVSQGKGATRAAARVSALMEAIELHHAELVRPDPDATAIADVLADTTGNDWCRGRDLLCGRPVRLPHAVVAMDLARPDRAGQASSNGLASGNDRDEAIVAALCEVIERDAHACWLDLPSIDRHAAALDPDSITAPLGRRLLRRVAAAGLGFRLWSFGEVHGVAAIACAIYELGSAAAVVLPPMMGTGAHLDPAVALARAICEAAQARGTMIAGARDDLVDGDYREPGLVRLRFFLESIGHGPPRRDWSSLASHASGCLARDRDTLLDRCARRGAAQVACVDLRDSDVPVAVVKLVVPGFRGHAEIAAARA